MRSRGRVAEWVITWLVVGVLLAGGFLVSVFHREALAVTGLTRDGAPTTVSPTLFAPPTTPEATPAESPTPPPAGTGLVAAVELPAPGVLPDRAALEAKIAALDTSKLVPAEGGEPVVIGYEVVDVASGEVVAAAQEKTPLIPASNTKTLTALAVMNAFEGSETFATRVVQPAPGQLVLVGGGDPMLRSIANAEGAYPQLPTTEELAKRTVASLRAAGVTSVTLGYDESHFAGPGWNETWPETYRDQVTAISALWIDEGRGPRGGPRSLTPALTAATTFAAQLNAFGVAVTGAPVAAPGSGDAEEIARIESLPVHILVEQFMQRSNNSFTEVMGHQLAVRTGHPATFAGSVAAIQEQLSELGIWDEGTVLHDASGLSRGNRFTPNMLAAALARLASEPRLSVTLDGLPTAGVTGTLAERFADPVSRPARGIARAKTGSLSLVATLGGTTLTADDRLLAFAFFINGAPDGFAARVWTDQATGTLASCGC
ncbi:D-alanyl-D-alanine carboxypeptidase/D-alanyl-D-alanine-endopeptidase [Tessaracoccus sp. MC1756]|uniref:D-alanyl-D-alanine carboxypeptidase/D-alanyl-D-alanine endopeptidase n=1 Tax=Tessaracoccus sp. MC1756 TaxID=2760311 RepID=UPI001603B878|nr:D-alanyl-D-alanine carboxypeptidase/D-alanyl-D-alanine-endopeptidase [Tessaracoccus sp. MC1756]